MNTFKYGNNKVHYGSEGDFHFCGFYHKTFWHTSFSRTSVDHAIEKCLKHIDEKG